MKLAALALVLALALVFILPPPPDGWEPDPADVAYISRTIWGETRGCPPEEQRAMGELILQRVESPDFPDTIAGVVLQQNQIQGYSPNNPEAPFHALAREILIDWHHGERVLPEGMFWCSGDGKHQTFRDSWIITAATRYWPENK